MPRRLACRLKTHRAQHPRGPAAASWRVLGTHAQVGTPLPPQMTHRKAAGSRPRSGGAGGQGNPFERRPHRCRERSENTRRLLSDCDHFRALETPKAAFLSGSGMAVWLSKASHTPPQGGRSRTVTPGCARLAARGASAEFRSVLNKHEASVPGDTRDFW